MVSRCRHTSKKLFNIENYDCVFSQLCAILRQFQLLLQVWQIVSCNLLEGSAMARIHAKHIYVVEPFGRYDHWGSEVVLSYGYLT